MMKRQSAIKNYFYNLSYQILTLFVPFITTPYISRVLSAELIGVYSYTSSIVSYFALFAALGLNTYGQREIAYAGSNKKKQSEVFWKILKIKFFTVSISLLSYLYFVNMYGRYTDIFTIQLLSIVSIFFDVTWFYQGRENFQIVALRNIIVKVVCVIAVFMFVKSANDLVIYVIIIVLSGFLSNLVLCVGIAREISYLPVRGISVKQDLKTVIELFVPLIAIQVYNVLDKTMIGAISNSSVQNGYYEQTQKIIYIVMTVITSLGTVLFPSISRYYSENKIDEIKQLVNKSYKAVFCVSCPSAFGIIAVADNFVPIFFGSGYEPVINLLYVYALVIIIIPISNIAGNAVLTPTKQQNKGTISVVAGAFVNFILNSILIPRYYAMGAAIATVIAETLVSIIHVYFSRNYLNIKKLCLEWLKHLAAALIMFICVVGIGKYLMFLGVSNLIVLIAQVIVGVGIYGLIVVFVTDKKFIRELMGNILGSIQRSV